MPDWFTLTPPVVERGRRWFTWRMLMLEAVAYLAFARLALTIVPFRRLIWLFERPARQPELCGNTRTCTRKEVRSAILLIRRRWPGATTCFHRAIAAQAMLRRRGVSTTLYYGAAILQGRGLTTHAWVQDGGEGVVGCIAARQDHYHILARYRSRNLDWSNTGDDHGRA